jgi:hypothetical protein
LKRKLASIIAAAFAITHLTAFDFTTLIPIATGALGGLGCAALYKGEHQALVASLCALGTGLVGMKFRDYLKEQEQAELTKATYTTLETGKTETIKTEQGNTITTELIKPESTSDSKSKIEARQKPREAPAASEQQVATAAEGECGTVKQTVVTKDNQRVVDTVSACKKEGTWVVG